MIKSKYASMTVLIVEDTEVVRVCLTALLRRLGIYNIKEACDGTVALEILKKEKFDLVLSDLLMAPMDGIEFTLLLRQQKIKLNNNVPVLMISASSEAAAIKKALQAGVTDFLPKPITAVALASRLQAILINPKPLRKSVS